MKILEKFTKRRLFLLTLIFAVLLFLPQKAEAASKKYFTPITPYFGKGVKIGKYYYGDGGTNWFWQDKKKKPDLTKNPYHMYLTCDDFTTNGKVAYGYHTVWEKYRTIGEHRLYKYNVKSGKKRVLKVFKDKVNPNDSSEDGFKFGTAYGSYLYYNATQKLTKSDGGYVYTYKLMRIHGKKKKTKRISKNFEILESTKKYIVGRNSKNKYYIFNLKKNKFYKLKKVPKAEVIITHNAYNVPYAAAFNSKSGDGYKKIDIYTINCSKRKLVKKKTFKAEGDGYLDGYFGEGYFYLTRDLREFSKMNLKTGKIEKITDREYDYDLAPDYD